MQIGKNLHPFGGIVIVWGCRANAEPMQGQRCKIIPWMALQTNFITSQLKACRLTALDMTILVIRSMIGVSGMTISCTTINCWPRS